MYQNKLKPTLNSCPGPKYYVSGFLFIGWTVRGIFRHWNGHILSMFDTYNLCRHTFPQQSENEKNGYIFVSILRKLQGCILCEEMSCSTPNSKYLPPVFGEYYHQQKVLYSTLYREATPIVENYFKAQN